jgi:hypothetical protein
VSEAAERRGDPEHDNSTVVAVLLAAAAVAAAVIGFRAALLGDSGSDTFHTAVREDVKRGSAIVEDSRFVYSEQAPAALEVASERVQGEELDEQAKNADPEIRDLVATEAAKHEGVLGVILEASAIATEPKYAQGDGFDVPAALADKRAENPDLVAIDPDSTEGLGIDRSRKATLLVAATIPAGLAFLFGALAQGFPGRRRLLVQAGFASVGLAVLAAILIEMLA